MAFVLNYNKICYYHSTVYGVEPVYTLFFVLTRYYALRTLVHTSWLSLFGLLGTYLTLRLSPNSIMLLLFEITFSEEPLRRKNALINLYLSVHQ